MKNLGSVYVIGGGGHAKVVVQAIGAMGGNVVAVFDDNPNDWEKSLLSAPIVGPINQIAKHPPLPAVIAIGDNGVRRILAESLALDWATVVHPRAYVDPSVELGAGTVVLPGAIVQIGTIVGNHAIINTSASVDHDCVIGDCAHIAPGVHLAGGVAVGNGVLMGIGSVATPGIRIEDWATVGAGTVVVQDIPANSVAVGVPAQVKMRDCAKNNELHACQ